MNILNKIKNIFLLLLEGSIRNISGTIGRKIRYVYYKQRFKKCGTNVIIDEGVIFRNPENMSLGNNIWINSYSILTAKPLNLDMKERVLIKKVNKNFYFEIGEIVIDDNCGIGSFNVLQGYGGIHLENNVTLSDYVKLFSFSHYPFNPFEKEQITYSSGINVGKQIVCIESPLVIQSGTWLALNSTMFKGTIGKNSFITANSIIMDDLEDNSYASGAPAKKIKNRFEL